MEIEWEFLTTFNLSRSEKSTDISTDILVSIMKQSQKNLFQIDILGRYCLFSIEGKGKVLDSYPCSPSLENLRLFTWYHLQKQGNLPYYKTNVFSTSWMKLFAGNQIENKFVIPIVFVVDKKDKMNMYVIWRKDHLSKSLRESSHILRCLFASFHNRKDQLQSEKCLLLHKLLSSNNNICNVHQKLHEKQLELVEDELELIENEEMTSFPTT